MQNACSPWYNPWHGFDGNIFRKDSTVMSESDPEFTTVDWIAARYMLDREYSDIYAFRVWVWSNWVAYSRNMSIWVSPTEVSVCRAESSWISMS